MSVTVEYSFNSELTPSELAGAIGRRLGCTLRPDPGDPDGYFVGDLFGMELALWAQPDLVNDRELNFEDYRYQLGNTTRAGSPLRPIQVEVIALAAVVLHEPPLAIHRGMLSYDGQALLARYEPRGEAWFDLVGGKRVVYPEHLVEIKARIPVPARRV